MNRLKIVNSMKHLIVSTLLSLLCICCSDVSGVDSDAVVDSAVDESVDLVAVEIESSITTTTRVSGTSWEDGDQIGIFMTYFTSGAEIVDNICYTTEGDGRFTPDDEDETIYYPENTSTVNLLAYSPYSSDVESYGSMEIDLSDNQESVDILRAFVSGIKMEDREEPVIFDFKHRLSKIDVVIYPGDGYTITSLAWLKVYITEQSQTATYVAYTDVLTPQEEVSEMEIESSRTSDSSGGASCYNSSAIIFPQTASEGCELRIDLNNDDSFTHSLSGVEFCEGENMIIYLSVNKHGLEILSSSIVAWGDPVEGYLSSDLEYVPIWDEDDLIAYRDDVNSGVEVKSAILMDDITLTASWSPIGSDIYPYIATFNGNGYSISGLTISDANSSCQGLFGVVGDGITEANIADLTIVSPNIVAGNSCGAVAGMSNKATFSRCVVDGGVILGADYTGIIVGVAAATTLEYCSSTISSSADDLVGSLRDGSIVIE